MSAHVLVIGGGFAGLRAAVSLSDAGCRVTVVDNRAHLGGRARSFPDPATGEVVDNGQHLFLAGYERTLVFLDRLGTRDQVVFQPRLQVRFVEAGGASVRFDCPRLPAPLHLWAGFLRLRGVPLRDKLGLVRMLGDLRDGAGETVDQWLARMGQGERSRRLFWTPLTLAALNERPERASAAGLKAVLRVLLARPASWSRLGVARAGLSDLYAVPARRVVEQKGGRVLLNKTVQRIFVKDGKAVGVELVGGDLLEADAVIAAVPPAALKKLMPGWDRLPSFEDSPILSVNLWLDRTDWAPAEPFVALIGTRFQWLFNKPAILGPAQARYLSLIVSAAADLEPLKNEPLVAAALEDLRACFPAAAGVKVLRSQVVREREATVSLTPETEPARPGFLTDLPNLFLAGDWTSTGLPATIESAVVSGETAARELLKKLASAPPAR